MDGGLLNPEDNIMLVPCSRTASEAWEYRLCDNTIRPKSQPDLCMRVEGWGQQGDVIQLRSCYPATESQWDNQQWYNELLQNYDSDLPRHFIDGTIRLKSHPDFCMNAHND